METTANRYYKGKEREKRERRRNKKGGNEDHRAHTYLGSTPPPLLSFRLF